MHDPETINIPAFKRKRSIAAKARKKPSYRLSKTSTKKRPKKQIIIDHSLSDIPTRKVLPSQDLFPEEELEIRNDGKLREMKLCGLCEGYFDNIDVAIIKLTSPLRVGDIVILEKNKGLFEEEITSMQINRKEVKLAKTGSDIGIKVRLKPKVGTSVYKVI